MRNPLLSFLLSTLLGLAMIISFAIQACGQADTIVVQVFTFDDPSPEGWNQYYRGKALFPMGPLSFEKILMVRTLKCDSATRGDKYPCGEWDYLTHTLVYKPRGDTVEAFQLGSFVTPYGKRLELGGDKGWTWVYDVTDYAPLLRGEVEISSGNNQELLDLKFLMIPGTPPRKVLEVNNLYPFGTYRYGELADDSVLKKKKIALREDARGIMLRARISGHGHNGPRNCCEWDSKTHTYYINEWEHFRWNVWKDCGFNPVYPQGGTWPFDRAGWCPGTKVDEYDFELTGLVKPGDTMLVDYGIEAYRENGEKDGEFRMSHQLFYYGPPNFMLDARIEDILAPSAKDSYSRLNPVCSSPGIIIRNTGKHTLKTLEITYGLKGGKTSTFTWHGQLEFLEKEEVWLPPPSWEGLETNREFRVSIDRPNGGKDGYPANNTMTTHALLPETMPSSFVLHIESNDLGRAADNAYAITDGCGAVLFERAVFEDSTTYNDTITLDEGCYEFRLTDKMEDGMIRHWWNYYDNPDEVGINGRIEFRSLDGEVLRPFYFDFGQEILYRFKVGNMY
jgi:hypothetical protein